MGIGGGGGGGFERTEEEKVKGFRKEAGRGVKGEGMGGAGLGLWGSSWRVEGDRGVAYYC